MKWNALASTLLFVLGGCAVQSSQQVMAKDRAETYRQAYIAYIEAEDEYIVLLSNIERYPADPYLLNRKQILMKELEHLRNLMLQSRGEYDESVQAWEVYLRDQRSAQKAAGYDPTAFPKEAKPLSPNTILEGR